MYPRSGFDCEILSIANCEFLKQIAIKRIAGKEYTMNKITCEHTLLLKCSTLVLISTVRYKHVELLIVDMSIRRHFKSKVYLPTPSHAQLSPNILRELVNQAVTATLGRDEAGN